LDLLNVLEEASNQNLVDSKARMGYVNEYLTSYKPHYPKVHLLNLVNMAKHTLFTKLSGEKEEGKRKKIMVRQVLIFKANSLLFKIN
jgi:hypothetical protein